jgi:hypothetical protein
MAVSWWREARDRGFVPESGHRTTAESCLEPPGRGSEREERGAGGTVIVIFSDVVSSGEFHNEASGSGGVENEASDDVPCGASIGEWTA